MVIIKKKTIVKSAVPSDVDIMPLSLEGEEEDRELTLYAASIEDSIYRDVIDIKVNCNGTVEPSTINIGNRYESNVVKLKFDTSALKWFDSTKDQYQALITFIGAKNQIYYTYEFDGEDFSIPDEVLSSTSDTLTCVITFREKLGDTQDGNITDNEDIYQETLTTAPITCAINTAIHNSITIDDLASVTAVEDNLDSLSKCQIDVSQLVKNQFTVSDKIIGTTLDNYIRFFSFAEECLGLSNYYIYIENSKKRQIGLIKFNSNGHAWISNDITFYTGDVQVNFIASDLLNRVYISNPIMCSIVDNKLNTSMLEPNHSLELFLLYSADGYWLAGSDAEDNQGFKCN